MPDETPVSTPTPAPAPAGGVGIPGLENLTLDVIERALLELIPEAGTPVVWQDVEGNEWTSPDRLSARRQALIGQAFKRHSKTLAELFTSIGTPGGILADKLLTVADLKYAEALGEVYTVAHPDTVPEGKQAIDLFGTEEMIKALVPFSARLLLVLARILWPAIEAVGKVVSGPPAPST